MPLARRNSRKAAASLVSAIERTEGDIALGGLAVLLGKTRIEAHARDAARIIGDGKLPLVVALAAHNGDALMTSFARSFPQLAMVSRA